MQAITNSTSQEYIVKVHRLIIAGDRDREYLSRVTVTVWLSYALDKRDFTLLTFTKDLSEKDKADLRNSLILGVTKLFSTTAILRFKKTRKCDLRR